MTRRAVFLGLLLAAAVFSGARRDKAEVRICPTLDEAVPPPQGMVLLVFFSTECVSCYDDLFEARYLVEKGGWPVTVVGVFSGLHSDLRSFLEKYAWTLPVVLDRRRVLFKRFKVDAVPYKALLAAGEAVYRDDPYKDFGRRRKELQKCLLRIFSR
jgi:hypothetical protein